MGKGHVHFVTVYAGVADESRRSLRVYLIIRRTGYPDRIDVPMTWQAIYCDLALEMGQEQGARLRSLTQGEPLYLAETCAAI